MYSNPEVKLDQKLSKTFNCYKTTTSKTTKNIFTLWKGFPKKKKKKRLTLLILLHKYWKTKVFVLPQEE